MARRVGFSMTTIGIVGPAVIGTEPTGRAVVFCSTVCMVAAWARGSKAASSGPIGRPSWPTVSGVQTWPVLGSRNSGEPVEAVTSTELLVWASTAGASIMPARQSDSVVSDLVIVSPPMDGPSPLRTGPQAETDRDPADSREDEIDGEENAEDVEAVDRPTRHDHRTDEDG